MTCSSCAAKTSNARFFLGTHVLRDLFHFDGLHGFPFHWASYGVFISKGTYPRHVSSSMGFSVSPSSWDFLNKLCGSLFLMCSISSYPSQTGIHEHQPPHIPNMLRHPIVQPSVIPRSSLRRRLPGLSVPIQPLFTPYCNICLLLPRIGHHNFVYPASHSVTFTSTL